MQSEQNINYDSSYPNLENKNLNDLRAKFRD
jgi:hypothetical protein